MIKTTGEEDFLGNTWPEGYLGSLIESMTKVLAKVGMKLEVMEKGRTGKRSKEKTDCGL